MINSYNNFSIFRPPPVVKSKEMALKSDVMVLSAERKDPATRAGMISVLEPYTKYCAEDINTNKKQSSLVWGDFSFFNTGI